VSFEIGSTPSTSSLRHAHCKQGGQAHYRPFDALRLLRASWVRLGLFSPSVHFSFFVVIPYRYLRYNHLIFWEIGFVSHNLLFLIDRFLTTYEELEVKK